MLQFKIVCELDIAFIHVSPQPAPRFLTRFVGGTVYLLFWSQSGLVASR